MMSSIKSLKLTAIHQFLIDVWLLNPFSYALGAQLLALLGEEEKANHHLRVAVQLFEKGMAEIRKGRSELLGWQEYAIMIMKAAGHLGDHCQVFNLYRRWEKYHVSWHNRYLAGVASFNFGRHARAASLWSPLASRHSFILSMHQVALMVDSGPIPPSSCRLKSRRTK